MVQIGSDPERFFIDNTNTHPVVLHQQGKETAMSENIYAHLPKVVYIEGVHDGGEGYRGHASERCPHCGAEGRYIYKFRCEDGNLYGAMRGCFGKFPKSKLVIEHERLIEKVKDFKGKGWTFPWYEQSALDAIEAFGKGEGTEDQAWAAVNESTRQKRLYADRMKNRRR